MLSFLRFIEDCVGTKFECENVDSKDVVGLIVEVMGIHLKPEETFEVGREGGEGGGSLFSLSEELDELDSSGNRKLASSESNESAFLTCSSRVGDRTIIDLAPESR